LGLFGCSKSNLLAIWLPGSFYCLLEVNNTKYKYLKIIIPMPGDRVASRCNA
jgi:hypothetical protein